VEVSGLEMSIRDLIGAVRTNQDVLIRLRTVGNLAASLAIRKDSILRRNPISHLGAIGAESFDSFIQSRDGVIERILLAIKKAFVFIRFLAIAICTNLRCSREAGHFVTGVEPRLDPS